MKQPLVMLAGLPGTGKTTNAKYLADALGYSKFDAVESRKQLGFTQWAEDQRPAVTQLVCNAVYESYARGRGAVVEANFGLLESRKSLYGIALNENLEVIIIEHTCPEDIAKRRMRNRTIEDGLSDPTNPEIYDRVRKEWQNIEGDFDRHPYISLIKYDTHSLSFDDIKVNQAVKNFVDQLKKLLMGGGRVLQHIPLIEVETP